MGDLAHKSFRFEPIQYPKTQAQDVRMLLQLLMILQEQSYCAGRMALAKQATILQR